jgi:hypothetical protein
MRRDITTAERLGAFSDGMIAVIITIMVLELKAPDDPNLTAILSLWPTRCAAGRDLCGDLRAHQLRLPVLRTRNPGAGICRRDVDSHLQTRATQVSRGSHDLCSRITGGAVGASRWFRPDLRCAGPVPTA